MRLVVVVVVGDRRLVVTRGVLGRVGHLIQWMLVRLAHPEKAMRAKYGRTRVDKVSSWRKLEGMLNCEGRSRKA